MRSKRGRVLHCTDQHLKYQLEALARGAGARTCEHDPESSINPSDPVPVGHRPYSFGREPSRDGTVLRERYIVCSVRHRAGFPRAGLGWESSFWRPGDARHPNIAPRGSSWVGRAAMGRGRQMVGVPSGFTIMVVTMHRINVIVVRYRKTKQREC